MEITFDVMSLTFEPEKSCYHAIIDGTFTYNGETFSKMYHCYYFAETPIVKNATFVHRNWRIHRPYIQFPTVQENQKCKRKIKQILLQLLDTLEERISSNEKKKTPIVSKMYLSEEDGKWMVKFNLRNQPGTFSCEIYNDHNKYWDMLYFYELKKGEHKCIVKPKSLFWYDHIFEQITELVRTKSKNRLKYFTCFTKKYFYKTFVKGDYRLEKVKLIQVA